MSEAHQIQLKNFLRHPKNELLERQTSKLITTRSVFIQNYLNQLDFKSVCVFFYVPFCGLQAQTLLDRIINYSYPEEAAKKRTALK